MRKILLYSIQALLVSASVVALAPNSVSAASISSFKETIAKNLHWKSNSLVKGLTFYHPSDWRTWENIYEKSGFSIQSGPESSYGDFYHAAQFTVSRVPLVDSFNGKKITPKKLAQSYLESENYNYKEDVIVGGKVLGKKLVSNYFGQAIVIIPTKTDLFVISDDREAADETMFNIFLSLVKIGNYDNLSSSKIINGF